MKTRLGLRNSWLLPLLLLGFGCASSPPLPELNQLGDGPDLVSADLRSGAVIFGGAWNSDPPKAARIVLQNRAYRPGEIYAIPAVVSGIRVSWTILFEGHPDEEFENGIPVLLYGTEWQRSQVRLAEGNTVPGGTWPPIPPFAGVLLAEETTWGEDLATDSLGVLAGQVVDNRPGANPLANISLFLDGEPVILYPEGFWEVTTRGVHVLEVFDQGAEAGKIRVFLGKDRVEVDFTIEPLPPPQPSHSRSHWELAPGDTVP